MFSVVPSFSLRSSSWRVGSISSHPTGGAFLRPNLGGIIRGGEEGREDEIYHHKGIIIKGLS